MNKHVTPLCLRLADSIINTECGPQMIFDKMYYDPVEGINKIRMGKKYIPAVLFSNSLGTETVTQVRFEDTDKDPQNNNALFLATRTITEVKAETTDEDPSSFMCLGTQTFTKVKGENTDQDLSQ